MMGASQGDTGGNWKCSQWLSQSLNDLIWQSKSSLLGNNSRYKILIQKRLDTKTNWVNRQISYAKRIPNNSCRHSVLRRWSITPYSFSLDYTQWLPSQEYSTEKAKKSRFRVWKSDKHYLSQMIKVNITHNSHRKHVVRMVPLCSSSPKLTTPCNNEKNNKSQLRAIP